MYQIQVRINNMYIENNNVSKFVKVNFVVNLTF